MWNMFKVNKKNDSVNDVVLVFLLLTLKYFTPFSSVPIIDSEQVNVSWDMAGFIRNDPWFSDDFRELRD